MQCPHCQHTLPEDSAFCPYCGNTVQPPDPEPSAACPHCGRELPEDSTFCLYCGRALQAAAPAPTAPKATAPAPTAPKAAAPASKTVFCRLCGKPIDPETKKCTGCGKQYFRGINPMTFLCIVMMAAILTLATLCIVQQLRYEERINELEDILWEYQINE